MRKILNYLFEHKTLNQQEAEEVLTNIARGQYSDPEISAFLTVYLMRSITVEELTGFRNALLKLCLPVDLGDYDLIDMCGTGGDGKDTFNISTVASFVVAGAGCKVAKHGNYAVSSSCGSSNVIEFLGYKFTSDIDQLKKDIEIAGICYLHAPLFNPAMKNVAPVRKALRIKTFFNMLGPLVNPSRPGKQLIGVFSLELARLYNYILQQSGKEYVIVHSLDGYDEISLTSEFKVLSNKGEDLMLPEDIGLDHTREEDLYGGKTVEEAAKIFIEILQGNGTTQQTQVVLANAAMGLKCYYPEKSLPDCIEMAKESIYSKKALQVLRALVGN